MAVLAWFSLAAPAALVAHCPSPAELEDVALASTSYNDLIAALRACAALAEQQQRLMSSAALLLGSPAGMEDGGAAPPVPPRRTVSTVGSTSLPPHGAVPPPVPPRRRRAAAAAPRTDLPAEGSPAPPVPPRRRRVSLPPADSPAPPVPPRRHRSPTADAAAAAAAVTTGDASPKPMRDRLATWHESREEQAAAQRAQQTVVARNLRAGKPQHVVSAATHLAEPQVWPMTCEPSLYRMGLPPVQGCSPLSAEAREYAHHATGGRHPSPEEPSLLRPAGGEVGCGRIVRDGLLDRKEQRGLIVCHRGLEPRASRQGPSQAAVLLTRASLVLDRRPWSARCGTSSTRARRLPSRPRPSLRSGSSVPRGTPT